MLGKMVMAVSKWWGAAGFSAALLLIAIGQGYCVQHGTERPARVVVASFVKDFPELVGDWISHHMSIFSPSNIIIIDGGSTDPATIAILRLASLQGVHVSMTPPSLIGRGHLDILKATTMAHALSMRASDADFLIPLDLDEFIGTVDSKTGKLTFTKSAVRAGFDRLLPTLNRPARYKFGSAGLHLCELGQCLSGGLNLASTRLLAAPVTSMMSNTAPARCMDKTFFPAAQFKFTDFGNHFGGLKTDTHNPADAIRTRACDLLRNSSYAFPRDHNVIIAHAHFAIPYPWYERKQLNFAAAWGLSSQMDCKRARTPYQRRACETLQVSGDRNLRTQMATRWCTNGTVDGNTRPEITPIRQRIIADKCKGLAKDDGVSNSQHGADSGEAGAFTSWQIVSLQPSLYSFARHMSISKEDLRTTVSREGRTPRSDPGSRSPTHLPGSPIGRLGLTPSLLRSY